MINGHRMNLHVEDAADPDEARFSYLLVIWKFKPNCYLEIQTAILYC